MKYIFSMKMAVFMLFAFGALIGTATFIENDYGTQTARALIYKTQWFEIFLGYFIAILIYNIIQYKRELIVHLQDHHLDGCFM